MSINLVIYGRETCENCSTQGASRNIWQIHYFGLLKCVMINEPSLIANFFDNGNSNYLGSKSQFKFAMTINNNL